jgi:RNA polymerase sigma factor (TIGR02999 family)
MLTPMREVTHILAAVERGDPHAAGQLLPLVYDELRKLAAARLAAEAADHTLQPTALVHEAYLRLVGGEQPQGWNGRAHFFGAAAEAMRRLLVDHARRKHGRRRGGSRGRRQLSDEDLVAIPLTDELVDLDDALSKLRAADPAAADLVTMRVFGGMTVEEIAAAQGTSPRTVKRDWAYARAWLGRELAAYDQRTG